MSKFIWSESRRRYTYASNGRALPETRIRAGLQGAIDASKARIDSFSAELIASRINAAEWTIRMRDEIKNGHRAAALLANGGTLNPSALGKLGATVRAQYDYLSRFSSQIQNGEVALDQRLSARAQMYAQAVLPSYENQVRAREIRAGSRFERRVLSPVESCTDCIEYARRGWQPIGTLPPIGDSICKSNCHCRFEYKGAGMLPDNEPIPPPAPDAGGTIRVEVPAAIADTGANARKRLADLAVEFERESDARAQRRLELVDAFNAATGRKKRQIDKLISELDQSQGQAEDDALAKYRSVLYQASRANFTVVKTGGLDRIMRSRVDEGVEFFQQVVGAGKLEGRTLTVYGGVNRASYGGDAIYLTDRNRPEIVAHELGHWLEEVSPTIRTEVLNFYARRTQGDLIEYLIDLDPSRPYRPTEVAKKDLWRDPYIGKLYRNARGEQTMTEVLAMGLQQMYENPWSLAQDDPDFFDFLYDVLRK